MIEQFGDKEKAIEQFKIRFTNLLINHLGGWWRQYDYKTFGNVLHWIYVYSMLSIGETVTIGENIVNYHGEVLATYELDDKLQMPVFKFSKDPKYNFIILKKHIHEN